jgi:hypothetical protein|tara:strand:- start:305 stop:514 length:210 start_codon:yes stop_codon:yes gene_type:complete
MKIKLTNLKIKSLKVEDKKYKVFDKQVSGLYLMVRPTGYKVFKLAYRIGKYQKESKLGEYPILLKFLSY